MEGHPLRLCGHKQALVRADHARHGDGHLLARWLRRRDVRRQRVRSLAEQLADRRLPRVHGRRRRCRRQLLHADGAKHRHHPVRRLQPGRRRRLCRECRRVRHAQLRRDLVHGTCRGRQRSHAERRRVRGREHHLLGQHGLHRDVAVPARGNRRHQLQQPGRSVRGSRQHRRRSGLHRRNQ